MKKIRNALGLFVVLVCLSWNLDIHAQGIKAIEPNKEIKVKKHTVLGQYEPGMVISADERIQLKSERITAIKLKRMIIDTLDISDRKRRRLLRELYRSPFTYQWDKFIATIEAEDEEEDE